MRQNNGDDSIGYTKYDGKNIYGYGNVRLAPHYVHYLLNEIDYKSILDIGCGDGIIEKYLKKEINYSGIDIDAGIYKKSKGSNIKYINNADDLKKNITGIYDVSVLINVLEHTDDFTSLFEAALKVTENTVLMTLPNTENLHNRILFLFGYGLRTHTLDMVGLHLNHRHLWVIQYDKVISVLAPLAQKYNFNITKTFYYLPYPSTKWKRIIYRSIIWFIPWKLKGRGFGLLFKKNYK